jgi:energy-coupling factor transporter ATP-binding protein EcfA2
MPSALDLKEGQKSYLVYGPTGAGKTTLFTTIPGKKFSYVFDPGGLTALAGQDIDYELFLPDTTLGLRRTIKGKRDTASPKPKEPLSYTHFEGHLEEFLEGGIHDYDIIGFHSLTSLQIMVMERLLWVQGRWGQQPEFADYNMLGETMMAIFRTLLGKGVSVFAEAHSDLVQDEVSRKIINRMDLTKGVRRFLPRLVSDVWVASTFVEGGDAVYQVQTMPSKEFPEAKNTYGLPPFQNVTLNKLQARTEQGVGGF